MPVTFLDGLPGLKDPECSLSLQVQDTAGFLRTPRCLARICLPTGTVDWLVERSLDEVSESTLELPRRIQISGSDLWVSENGQVAAELLSSETGDLTVSVRNAQTGQQLWKQLISVPEAVEWTETSPAWPGAPTEEINAFFAADPRRLIACLFRQSRRSRVSYGADFTIFDLPPYNCQTDATRFDPMTGKILWSNAFPDLRIGISERESYTGVWSNASRLGIVDLETGINTVLHDDPHEFGFPVPCGSGFAVSWHSKREVGVEWFDEWGKRIRSGVFKQPRVRSTRLHNTGTGLAIQANDAAMLWWLGEEELPIWSVLAKPYIYRVHRFPETDIFVGTDGNGGRLLSFDPQSGQETLNLKPVLGGVGDLSKVPDHPLLVASFRTSKSYSVPPRLLVVSMEDRSHRLDYECQSLVGTWQHGAVCRAGKQSQRLAIVDLRSSDTTVSIRRGFLRP